MRAIWWYGRHAILNAMSRAIVVVCAIIALAVIGGIVYVHYVYLPQMAAQSNNVAQKTATSTMPLLTSTTSISFTKNATGTVRTTVPGSKNCNNDINCLIAAATDNCSPVSGEYTFQYSANQQNNQTSGISLAIPGLTFTLNVEYKITGQGSGAQCFVYKDITGVSVQASQSLIQQSLAQGMTMAQFNEQLAGLNNFVSVPKNFYGTCSFSASGLAADIHQLQSGGLTGEMSISASLTSATTTSGTVRDVCHNYFKN